MNPTQAVVLTQLVAFALFWLAGSEAQRKAKNSLLRLRGKPQTATSNGTGPQMTVEVAAGWAVMFLFLTILTDVPATSDLGTAFAWLILLSIALAYGADAFDNITTVLSGKTVHTKPVATEGVP